MKKINPILLLFLVLNYTFYQGGILVNYFIDVEAYTEAFCENIDQPELKCHGTCHLTKVLAKSEEEKKGNQESSPPVEILQLYLPASDDLKTGAEPEEKTRNLLDRKSTRLNSSHVAISYAVFCLKKKNK